METSTALFRKTTLCICLAFVALGACESPAHAQTRVERWGVFELVLDGPDSDSAYVDVTFAATFKSDSKTVTVPGFYDGDGTYKVRFSPPTLGRWTYSTESNRETLAAKTGAFTCIAPSPANHGPVQVVNTFYLQYADGTPYYAVGTTAYQWTSVDQSIQEKTLKTLATAPFNKIRMCVFPKWYRHGNDTEPWAYPFQRDGDRNDFTRPNYAFFRNFDLRVRQLAEMGIQADVIVFHPYDKWGYSTMGSENDDRYVRYLMARLSAYRNVWWSMANEWDLMVHQKKKTVADFDRFFQICQKEDPHQRLRGNHNWYYSEDHFYDHSHPWVTHASLQTNQLYNLVKWRRRYQKPVLVDEMRYEGDVSSGWGNLSAEEMTSYFWMAGLSGAYPTHGDTFDNRAGDGETRWWGKGGTLPGKSVPRIAFFKEIMEQAPVTEMTPTIETEDTGSTKTLSDNIHVFAKPGQYYLAYVASAGKTIRFDLPEGARYTVELIDTQNLTINPLPDATPGPFSFKTTDDYSALRVIAAKTNPRFVNWLKGYIPTQYPGVQVDDHGDWFQAKLADSDLIVSWAELSEPSIALERVEGLREGKALFVAKGTKESWADVASVVHYEGAGYYIGAYDSDTMGDWEVGKLTVVQFDGDGKMFAERMANTWVKGHTATDCVERWGVFEITLPGPASGNPYLDVEFSATFTQGDRRFKVPGFWYGDDIYKIRFSPPTVGQWDYETTSATPELDAKTGSFAVSEATGSNHGPVKVVDTFYFQYADGSRYHMLGTTSYQWTSMAEEIQQQTLKSLAASAFNKYRFGIPPKWYEHNRIEPDKAAFVRVGDKYDFDQIDPTFWARFEQRLLDLQELGIEADVILWHPYDKWHDTPLPVWRFNRMGKEQDLRYLRYCIARLSAFRNVWWSLANEWEWAAHSVEDFERFGMILQEEDPHQRLRSIHNGRKVYDQTRPWITHVSLQKHDTANGLKYRNQWAKPIVFDEYGYEGNIPEGYGRASGQDVMKKTYAATFSGAYPTHGECFQDPNEVIWWGKGGQLKGESWKRFRFLGDMLQVAPPFNELKPGNAMLVKEGEYYLVYCSSTESKTVQLSGTRSYNVECLDAWEMTVSPVGTASPGAYIFTPSKAEVVYRFTLETK